MPRLRRTTLTKKVAYSLVPLFSVLIVTEGVLRLGPFDFNLSPMEIEYSSIATTDRFQGLLYSDDFITDPVTFWKPKPSVHFFNSLGYRGEEMPEQKDPGEFRILAVGDSNTLGHETSWVNELSTLLDPAELQSERISVVNAGVYGYTSYQGKHRLSQFLRYEPDVVLISFAGNEASFNRLSDREFAAQQRSSVYQRFGRRLQIVNLAEFLSLHWALSRLKSAPEERSGELVVRVPLAQYEDDITEMVAMAKQAGAMPILMTRPRVSDYRSPNRKSRQREYGLKTVELGRTLGVGLIDVDEMANHTWALFRDHSHFSNRGHRVVGSYIASALKARYNGEDYDPEQLKYQITGAWERLRDETRKTFREKDNLEKNLDHAAARGVVSEAAIVRDVVFGSDVGGWRAISAGGDEVPSSSYSLGRSGLCFSDDLPLLSLVDTDLEIPSAQSPHLVWIEVETTSDATITLYWGDADGRFTFERSSARTFFRRNVEGPMRFFDVLPEGTTSARIDIRFKEYRTELCLKRVAIAILEP